MSFNVRKCGNEYHLRYRGLTQMEAQKIANILNSGFFSLTKYEEWKAARKALIDSRIYLRQESNPVYPGGV